MKTRSRHSLLARSLSLTVCLDLGFIIMLCSGSRILHHIRECNYNHHHQQQQNLGSGLGFCSSRIVQLSSFMLRPVSVRYHIPQRFASFSTKSPRSIPIRSDCLSPWREHCKFGTKKLYDESQREDDCDLSAEGSSSVAGGIVALGKFDALHIGHRELASQASKVGAPYLLSFVGMAEVFGWEPRAPIVAKCDRKRVLSSWAPYCGNMTPAEFQIEFSSVRHLTPQQFVEKLSKELRVSGVVAGENYRFGYKAAGDASELVRLCENYGMHAYIIKSVMDKNEDSRKMAASDYKDRGQVSSTRVRRALAVGDLNYVSELLGRRHRLVMMVNDLEELTSTSNSKCRVSAPKSCLLNLPPKEGLYENCFLFFGDESPVSCRVFIDTMRIHVEMDDIGLCNFDHSQDFQFLGIEFGGLES